MLILWATILLQALENDTKTTFESVEGVAIESLASYYSPLNETSLHELVKKSESSIKFLSFTRV